MAVRGILPPKELSPEIPNVFDAFARELAINQFPLVARLPREPVTAREFKLFFADPRTRDYTLGADIGTTGATTVTLNDNTPLMVGDVLEVGTERIEVTAIDAGGADITVVRGVEGTTAATHSNGAAVQLIGNSRTGAEVDQTANRAARSSVTQYLQTFQYPVQVGGLSAEMNAALADSDANLIEQARREKLEEMVRDVEFILYYGIGESDSDSSTGRAKMRGIREFAKAANTLTTDPTNKGSYSPEDLVRDVFEKAKANGSDVDILVVSTDWMEGFSIWGHPLVRIDAGQTELGVDIKTFSSPFLGDVPIILSTQLRPKTAFGLESSEVKMRHRRQESWFPRGRRGDAFEADWIADFAIDVGKPAHHAWVEGITAFAAS